MKLLTQLSVGLFSALGMVVIVFGALLLSLSEDFSFATAMSTPSAVTSPTAASSPVTPPPGITVVIGTEAPTPAPSLPGATLCPPPTGWLPYTVSAGDQLDALAAQAGVSAQQVMQANCLISSNLLSGTLLYLPYSATLKPSITPPPALPTVVNASATPTPTPQPACGPYRGWVLYTVQPSDTLYKLSQAFGVSIYQLQQANCLAGTLIQAGTRIYVPNVATRTPEVTATEKPAPSHTPVLTLPTDSATPTPTNTLIPPSETPTETPTETTTEMPTQTVTNTLAPAVPQPGVSTTPAPTIP